jgi:hypothetical protein
MGAHRLLLRLLKRQSATVPPPTAPAPRVEGRPRPSRSYLAKVLHNHFVKEEEFALPPIRLLSALAAGEVHEDMKSVFAMTDRLKAELSEMLEEHKAVVAALNDLIAAAKAEKKTGARALCREMNAARTNGRRGSLSCRDFGRRIFEIETRDVTHGRRIGAPNS